jgi:hypothetical protein
MTDTPPITPRHGRFCVASAGAITDYVAEARDAGAQVAILSSEELDYVLHVPQKAQVIEAEARAAGVTDIRWVAALGARARRSGPTSRS